MFNLDKFIADRVTKRLVSMFAADIETNREELTREIKDKKVCVIGGEKFMKMLLRTFPYVC